MKLLSFIRRLDILVKPFQFNVHNRKRTQTLIGGSFSILLFISYALYAISVINRQEQNQNTIYAGSQSDTSQNQGLDESIVHFALEITTYQGQPLYNNTDFIKYFTLDATYIDQRRESKVIGYTRNQTKLKMNQCNKNFINTFNFQDASITNEQKEQLLCFEGQFNISGQFYDPIFQYIKIKLNVCDNNTFSECKPIEEIEEFIKEGINIDLFIRGSKVKKSLNLTSPADSFPNDIFWRLTSGIGNNEDIYLAPIQFDLKKSSVFAKFTNEEPFDTIFNSTNVYRTERRQESIVLDYGVQMCSFYIRASSESFYYFSNSQDWLNILLSSISETTSLIMTLLRILQFFYGFYNKHKTFETIMNQVYKFDLSKQTAQDMDEIIQTSGIHNECQKSALIKKEKLDKLINFHIKYPVWRYIVYKLSKLLLCFKRYKICNLVQEEEITISQIAKHKIQKDLDLTNILQKLYEIDCLKLLLFDDDQLMIFNAFSSPVFEDNMSKQLHFKELIATQNRKSLRKQTFSKVDFSLVNTNKIHLNLKLQKLSRFFRAQIIPQDAEDLTQTFIKIQENQNENHKKNQKILRFAQSNYTLYKILHSYCLTKTNLQVQQSGEKKTDEALSIQIEERQDVKNLRTHIHMMRSQIA